FELDDVGQAAEVDHLLQQDDLHGGPLVEIRVRQQGEEARALDRGGQLPLVVRARARDPRRDDLAVLADEVLQQVDVFVVDPLDLLGREAAELAPLEQLLRALVVALAVPALAFTLAFESASTSRWGHISLLARIRPASRAARLSCSCGSSRPGIQLLSRRCPASLRRGASLPARTPPLRSHSSPCA